MRESATLNRIVKQLRPVLWHAGAVSFFINLLILPVSLYSLQVMDRVMATGSFATLFWLTLVMILLFAAAGVLQSLRSIMLQRVGDWFHRDITTLVLPITLAQASQSGGMQGAQGLRDAASVRQFVSGNGFVTLLDAPWSVLYITVLFIIHPLLGVMVTGGAFFLLALAWFNESMMQSPLKQAGAYQMQNMQELEFATRNADVIAGMGMEQALISRWQSGQNAINYLQGKAGARGSVVQGITKFARLTLQVLVTGVAAWLALDGSITIGAIIGASILASRALAPFEAAIGSWKTLSEARQAFDRLDQMLGTQLREEGMSLPVPHGAISAENLYYTPPGQPQPLLKNISFHLEAGEILGIIGPSGSGKTTLARLLMGIWAPQSGIVRLDGANVYTWPREEFGRFTGYMPQDVELFRGSVKDNIARLLHDVPPEMIIEAAQLANAHEMILQLPKGYETEIGANGALLSAGQCQRIGLARAFFGSPRLLVLDEPDANLDDAGKQALWVAIKQAKLKRITTVVISHRKSILQHSDKLLMLRNGAVEHFGTPQHVLHSLQQRPAQEEYA